MTTDVSVAEYRALLKKGQHKYGAAPTQVDGYRFDSGAEAARYCALQLLASAGQIQDLSVHPAYELQPAFVDRLGKKWGAVRYVADFAYVEAGAIVVEDVKGLATAGYKLKAKLFRARYPDIDYRVLVVH
jgi:hypothetical protein